MFNLNFYTTEGKIVDTIRYDNGKSLAWMKNEAMWWLWNMRTAYQVNIVEILTNGEQRSRALFTYGLGKWTNTK